MRIKVIRPAPRAENEAASVTKDRDEREMLETVDPDVRVNVVRTEDDEDREGTSGPADSDEREDRELREMLAGSVDPDVRVKVYRNGVLVGDYGKPILDSGHSAVLGKAVLGKMKLGVA